MISNSFLTLFCSFVQLAGGDSGISGVGSMAGSSSSSSISSSSVSNSLSTLDGGYMRIARNCQQSDDCEQELGEDCFFLYDGCSSGQCMCDPTRRKYEAAKFCTTMQKLVNESCTSNDACREGMSCQEGQCRCRLGVVTPDRLFCLLSHHRLLGDPCSVSKNICLQKAVYGYTTNDVNCSKESGLCACANGYKNAGFTCKRRGIGEHGCLKSYQCEGGAICVDGQCQCPTGYNVPRTYSKCIKREAMINLPVGVWCDEINERRYCAQHLVCHRCDKHSGYKCVKFLKHNDYSSLLSSSSIRSYQHSPHLPHHFIAIILFAHLVIKTTL